MNDEYYNFELIIKAVKQAIMKGYAFWEFQEIVRTAIRQAIVDGYMFFDYLEWRHELEYEYKDEMTYENDEWEDYLIKAMDNFENGYSYFMDHGLNKHEGLMKKLGIKFKPRDHGPDFESDIDIALEIEKALSADDENA
jgi:hypothetical protein